MDPWLLSADSKSPRWTSCFKGQNLSGLHFEVTIGCSLCRDNSDKLSWWNRSVKWTTVSLTQVQLHSEIARLLGVGMRASTFQKPILVDNQPKLTTTGLSKPNHGLKEQWHEFEAVIPWSHACMKIYICGYATKYATSYAFWLVRALSTRDRWLVTENSAQYILA